MTRKISNKLALIKNIARLHHFIKLLVVEKYTVEIPVYDDKRERFEIHRHRAYNITKHFDLMLVMFENVIKKHFEEALSISVDGSVDTLKQSLDKVDIFSTLKPYHYMTLALIFLFASIYFAWIGTFFFTLAGTISILISLILWINAMRIRFIVIFKPIVKNYEGEPSPVVFRYFRFRRHLFSLITIWVYYPMVYKLELPEITEFRAFINILGKALDNVFVTEYAFQKLLENEIEIEHWKRIAKHYEYLANIYKDQANKYLEAYEEVASEVPIRKRGWFKRR